MRKAITISKQDPAFITKTMDVLERMLRDKRENPTDLPLSLLEDITGKFSDTCYIGSGGFADVYKGRLQNGREVAVKKLKIVEIDEKQFKQEVRSLMGVKHENIVRLLGYCAETTGKMLEFKGRIEMVEAERRRLLCFEFLPEGSLDRYITDASGGLEWHVRYHIIKGICLGLQHLHKFCEIAHMDLKPQNILMDDNMVAKIGDFGTSRLIDPNKSMVTRNIIGTPGYMAPEYIENGSVSKEADIFSLGVIILELLTGSRHYDLTDAVEVVGKWMRRLPHAAYSLQVRTCVLIAIKCVNSDKDKRPTTEYIINKLIKVESEITEKLIKEGQEWVEGITNVTVGVVALVLILQSWVLTIGVAVIVLPRLQNPMSSWPRDAAIECGSCDKDKRPTTECIFNKLIKVDSEIREKIINEGQEWVEGITNVTVGVVALVLILRSWVLTIGVAVIVLLRLQNPMSSWPRVVATECVSYDKDKRPTTESISNNKHIKSEFEMRQKLVNKRQESWSWVEGITNVTVGVVALVLILRSWVLTIGVAVIVLCLQNPMSWHPTVIGREAVLLTVLILMNPRSWSWVLLILKVPTALPLTILVKVAIFVGTILVKAAIFFGTILVKAAIFVGRILWHHEADLLTLLAKVVTAGSLMVLDRRRWSWMTLLFTLVSILVAVVILLTSWSWVAVTRVIMKTINPMNLLAIAFVDYYYWKSRAWIILFFAIEAVRQATVINLSLPLVATAYSVVRFLVGLFGIYWTTEILLYILETILKSSRVRAILFAEGGILLILLHGPIPLLSWLMVDIMTTSTLFALLGFMAVILLSLLWSPFTSESASLLLYEFLLYPVVVALAADIVIIGGILRIFAIFTFLMFICIHVDMFEDSNVIEFLQNIDHSNFMEW